MIMTAFDVLNSGRGAPLTLDLSFTKATWSVENEEHWHLIVKVSGITLVKHMSDFQGWFSVLAMQMV